MRIWMVTCTREAEKSRNLILDPLDVQFTPLFFTS